MRGLEYKRMQRHRAICRKKAICHHYDAHPVEKRGERYYVTDFSRQVPMEWYYVDGRYDKGKIHCGCPLCKPTKRFGYPSFKQELLDERAKSDLKEFSEEETELFFLKRI